MWIEATKERLINPREVECVAVKHNEHLGKYAVFVITKSDKQYCIGYFDTLQEAREKQEEAIKQVELYITDELERIISMLGDISKILENLDCGR